MATGNKRGRPATGARPRISVHVETKTMERIAAAADSEFCTVSEIAGTKLDEVFGGEGSPAQPRTKIVEAREKEKEIDIQIKELRYAEELKQILTVDAVIDLVSKDYAVVRSRMDAIPESVVGLTPDQKEEVKAMIADAFADLAGTKKETWDDMAAES